MIGSILVFIVVTLVGFLCLQTWRKFNFFKDRNIPYHKGYPIVGSMGKLLFQLETFSDFILRVCEDYKELPLFGLFTMVGPTYMIRDLEMIKQITSTHADNFINRSMMLNSDHDADSLLTKSLLGLQGAKWKKMRAIVSPTFTSSKMRLMFDLIKESTSDMVSYLNENLRPDGTIEVKARATFMRVAINAIATIALGLKVDSLREADNVVYTMAMKQVSNNINLRTVFITVFPSLGKLLNLSLFDPESTNFFKKLINETVRDRQQKQTFRSDVIQLLMAEMDKLTNDELTAQAFIFFLGGSEAVSQNLQHSMYELAVNQDCQQKLYEEIQLMNGKLAGRSITYDELNQLNYLDAFLNEVMRKKIASLIERACNADTILVDSKGQQRKIEAGTSVMFPAYAINHDYRIYPNPERFNPEHFLGEQKKKYGVTFMPFGLGPRNCVGMRFGLMESKLVLYSIVSEFLVQPCIKTQIPFRMNMGFTNIPTKPIIVELKKR